MSSKILLLFELSEAGRIKITEASDPRMPVITDMAMDGLVGRDNDGAFILSERGSIWLDMILATPLPQQQWIDPRFSGSPAAQSAPAAAERPVAATTAQTKAPAAVPADLPQVDIPDGFIPVAPGSMSRPESLQTGKEFVHVIRRNGDHQQLYAASVNWKDNGKPDDPIAFKEVEEPESAHKAHIGNSAKAKGK